MALTKIKTDGVTDDAITSDKIPANAVGSSELADDAVDTNAIQDDAVTADKLANSINTEIAANTAKTTNATHTGEVTGATALTIASDVVDEDNLKVSNSPTNGQFLSAQSGNTGGLTWATVDLTALSASNLTSGTVPDARFPATLPAISGANLTNLPAGGITMADEWRITANFTGDSNPISSNWERMDTSPWRSGNLGTGLTESSGVFTFPATGWYYLTWTHSCRRIGTSSWNYMLLQLTNDNSSYSAYDFSAGEFYSGGSWYWTKNRESVLLDITNTTNQKFRFEVDNDSGDVVTMGATDKKETGFTIFRLGDT